MGKNRQRKRAPAQARVRRMNPPASSTFGVTEDWNLRDIKAVIAPPGYAGQILAVVAICGVNGLRYKILDITGSTISGGDYSYGTNTGQFAKLAGLYSTYRLKSIKFDFRPTVLQGMGAQAQSVTTIDVAAGDGLLDFPTSIKNFERSKNTQFHHALNSAQRKQDYAGWLMQTIDHPFLRTILGGSREFYQDDGIDRVPAIQLLSVFTRIDDSQIMLGWFETNVQYTFRGRRLDDETLPASSSPSLQTFVTQPQAQPQAIMTQSSSELTLQQAIARHLASQK